MEMPFQKSKKGVTLKIKVEPRSSRKGISGVVGDAIKIKVNAPPAGGAANEELIEVLSEEFGIKKTSIKILRGISSRNKVVEIEGITSV
ncbi:MAG: YggU family protein [Candidatus Atribacteria bacterium]|nr:MAG: YggU family protein [Candidatus Atribacteria bacterium]